MDNGTNATGRTTPTASCGCSISRTATSTSSVNRAARASTSNMSSRVAPSSGIRSGTHAPGQRRAIVWTLHPSRPQSHRPPLTVSAPTHKHS